MPYLIIIIIIIFLIIWFYLSFVIAFRLKLNKLEEILMSLFKKRNYKIVSLYYATDDFLSKHNEVFAEYVELKEKDFKESSLNYNIENKLSTYKMLHNEINFIFKICELNEKVKLTPKYNYIKHDILAESDNVWKKYAFYKEIMRKYKFHHKISKFFIVWLFLR